MSVREEILSGTNQSIYHVQSKTAGPVGHLPLTEEMLLNRPSGDIFGLSQNAGMGWEPKEVGGKQFLIVSTQGGVRAPDGKPIALGYHTGHWEIGLLVEAAAKELPRFALIRAMAVPKARRACSTACPIVTMRR
jgi:hypothetical protein